MNTREQELYRKIRELAAKYGWPCHINTNDYGFPTIVLAHRHTIIFAETEPLDELQERWRESIIQKSNEGYFVSHPHVPMPVTYCIWHLKDWDKIEESLIRDHTIMVESKTSLTQNQLADMPDGTVRINNIYNKEME